MSKVLKIQTAAQRLADDANVAFWMHGTSEYNTRFHTKQFHKRIEELETRIAEYRDELASLQIEAAE